MHHELVPAIPSPTPGVELARVTGQTLLVVTVGVTLGSALISYLCGWFWLGLQLAS